VRKVLRNRWYCDHCKKSSGTGAAMTKHERGCTNNPERVCGMCAFAGLDAKPLPELKAFVLAHSERDEGIFDKREYGVLKLESIASFKELAGDCPACMFAAMRQTTTFFPSAHEFKLKDEMRKVLAECNDSRPDY
jgi:hypothetical protein